MSNGKEPAGTFFDNLQAAAEAPDPRPKPGYHNADREPILPSGPWFRSSAGNQASIA